MFAYLKKKQYLCRRVRQQLNNKIMRKGIVIGCICALVAHSVVCFSEQAVYNEISYTIDRISGTAEVGDNTKSPAIKSADGQLVIPAEIQVGQIVYRVTGIAENAFKGCKNLTGIALPNTLEYMSRNAFEGTGIWLKKKNWKDGVLIVDSCLIAADKNIKSKYVVPEHVRLIAAGAFQGNKSLSRIELPPSLERIDNDLFRDCKSLSKVVIPASVKWIGQDVFVGTDIWLNEKKWKKGALYIDGCLIAVNSEAPAKFVFKDKVPTRVIAAGAFSNAKQIRSLSIPDGIETIPVACFYKCTGLAEVVIPKSVKHVERLAFAECESLKNAMLPSDLESLGAAAFMQCRLMKKQVISDRLKGLPTACFYLCSELRDLSLPQSIEVLGDGVFAGCINIDSPVLPERLQVIGEKAFAGCTKLRKIVVPESVAKIGKGAFSECTHLTEIILPDRLYAIDAETFMSCISLEKMRMPESLYRIGSGAFAGCINLQEVAFNLPLKSIEDGAFYQCRQLREVVLLDSLGEIGADAFMECKNLQKLVLPAGIQKIGEQAFRDCHKLIVPALPREAEVGKNAFKGCKQR